jgi:hypothetical protein
MWAASLLLSSLALSSAYPAGAPSCSNPNHGGAGDVLAAGNGGLSISVLATNAGGAPSGGVYVPGQSYTVTLSGTGFRGFLLKGFVGTSNFNFGNAAAGALVSASASKACSGCTGAVTHTNKNLKVRLIAFCRATEVPTEVPTCLLTYLRYLPAFS